MFFTVKEEEEEEDDDDEEEEIKRYPLPQKTKKNTNLI